MLSKLFSNIKLGLSIWLILFSLALWSLTYYLRCAECLSTLTALDWIEVGSVSVLLIVSLFLNSSIFNGLFRVTDNNYYSPLFLAIFISWSTIPLQWETGLEVLLIAIFYLNTYNILNGKDENQVGFHLTAGLLSLLLTWLSPIGIGFLAVAFWQAAIDSHSSWRKFILPFYSFAISFLLFLGIAFLFDSQDVFLSKFRIWEQVSIDLDQIKSNGIQIGLTLVFFLLAQKEYLKALRKAPILKRKILSILNIQFISSFLLLLIFGAKTEYIIAPLFALSVLIANYLQYFKKFMLRELIIWILIVAGIISASINLL
jgi:hypothetical protein